MKPSDTRNYFFCRRENKSCDVGTAPIDKVLQKNGRVTSSQTEHDFADKIAFRGETDKRISGKERRSENVFEREGVAESWHPDCDGVLTSQKQVGNRIPN